MVTDLKRSYCLTRQQIEYDIRQIVDGMQKTFDSRIADYVVEQLIKIDMMEAEAWTAWEKSKLPRKETTIETKKPEKQEQGAPTPAQDLTIKSIERGGDVRYFEKLQWCVEIRLKLLGFFQPTQNSKTLDMIAIPSGDATGKGTNHSDGIVVYIPDNGR